MQTLLNPTRNMDHYRDPFHISRIILDFIGLLQNLDKKKCGCKRCINKFCTIH